MLSYISDNERSFVAQHDRHGRQRRCSAEACFLHRHRDADIPAVDGALPVALRYLDQQAFPPTQGGNCGAQCIKKGRQTEGVHNLDRRGGGVLPVRQAVHFGALTLYVRTSRCLL